MTKELGVIYRYFNEVPKRTEEVGVSRRPARRVRSGRSLR
jgi:hypothetical protein